MKELLRLRCLVLLLAVYVSGSEESHGWTNQMEDCIGVDTMKTATNMGELSNSLKTRQTRQEVRASFSRRFEGRTRMATRAAWKIGRSAMLSPI